MPEEPSEIRISTVRELIKVLQKLPPDAQPLVYDTDYDFSEYITGVTLEKNGDVYIRIP